MPESTRQRLTIALVGDSLHVGGVETHILSLLQHGDPTLYRWLVIASASPDFERRAATLGARVLMWKPRNLWDAAAMLRLVRLIRSHGVDLLHAHGPRAAVFGRLAGRLLGLPIVVTVHLPPYYYIRGQGLTSRSKRRLYQKVEQLLNHRCTSSMIYVSSQVYREALSEGLTPRSRTAVIPNGIDLTRYATGGDKQSVRAALSTPAGATVVCCIGRLDPQKGIDVLLEAVHLLSVPGETLRVWLVGDGSERAALEVRARRLGLESSVQFLGFRDDVAELLQASDVFVLPSRYEAMPITILEAMASGLPCVVTDVGDNAELVEDGVRGKVVPREDPHALVEAMNELMLNPALRRTMGEAARHTAQRYSAEEMAGRILTTYDTVMRLPPRHRT
jgi:glycosyltransferase involved in cell wall biosynthesis